MGGVAIDADRHVLAVPRDRPAVVTVLVALDHSSWQAISGSHSRVLMTLSACRVRQVGGIGGCFGIVDVEN